MSDTLITYIMEFLTRKYPQLGPQNKGEKTMDLGKDISKVGSFFKHFGTAIHSALLKVFGQPALDQVEQTLKTILTDDVRVIFEDGINAADTLTVGTGADKRAAAFAQISKDLATKGVALGTSAINLGIELIVGLLKAKTPAAA